MFLQLYVGIIALIFGFLVTIKEFLSLIYIPCKVLFKNGNAILKASSLEANKGVDFSFI